MKTEIGPYQLTSIVLCSGDAGPRAQRDKPGAAAYFFPGAKWVGAVRNSADRLGCRFTILTTAHGIVNGDDVIQPYDSHIDTYTAQVTDQWRQTVPRLLRSGAYGLMVFYAGGCPGVYLNILRPIALSSGTSLLSFGKPNMFDIDKLDKVIRFVVRGTTVDELKSILGHPEKFVFLPASA